MSPHRPPRDCPVCGSDLLLTRLGCPSCSTELSGEFEACEFCALGKDDREILRVFLASRGNMRELERHLSVSYPTARARFEQLLEKLGLGKAEAPKAKGTRMEVLEQLARGELDVDEALQQLR